LAQVPGRFIVMPAPGGDPVSAAKHFWIPAFETVSQFAKLHGSLFCHSGPDPEFSAASRYYVSGCRIKPGMTGRIQAFF